MKLLNEFREGEVITKAAEEIRRCADPIGWQYCGFNTMEAMS